MTGILFARHNYLHVVTVISTQTVLLLFVLDEVREERSDIQSAYWFFAFKTLVSPQEIQFYDVKPCILFNNIHNCFGDKVELRENLTKHKPSYAQQQG